MSQWKMGLMFGGEISADQAYEKFEQHVRSRGSVVAASTVSYQASGTYYFKYDIESGSLWGSPYGNYYTTDSRVSRIAQHCFPTNIIRLDYLNNNRVGILTINVSGSMSGYRSVTRNGITSSNWSSSWQRGWVTDFIYWDHEEKMAKRYTPINQTVPVPYTFQ